MRPERTRPKSRWRRIERWIVGLAMAMIAFVLEKMVLRSVRKAGKQRSEDELHTTFTSKGGEVDVRDLR